MEIKKSCKHIFSKEELQHILIDGGKIVGQPAYGLGIREPVDDWDKLTAIHWQYRHEPKKRFTIECQY